MITIKLYTNSSERNKIGKHLTLLSTQTGSLKQSVDILDPVLILEGVEVDAITNCNYVYIPELSRYYFVNSVQSIRNGLITLECHVDVLESYKDEIKANKGVIRRQAYQYNLYLDDGIFKSYQNPMVVTKNFPQGFTTASFVLAIAGR